VVLSPGPDHNVSVHCHDNINNKNRLYQGRLQASGALCCWLSHQLQDMFDHIRIILLNVQYLIFDFLQRKKYL
jgi:hypothetical protein